MEGYEDLDFDQFWDKHVDSKDAIGDAPEEEEVQAQEVSDKQDETAQAKDDTETTADQGDSDTKDTPGEIPYRRFSEVAKERREYKAKVKELEAALLEARKAQQAQPSAHTSKDEDDDVDALLKDILGDDYEAGSSSSPDPAIQARLDKLEQAQAQREFEGEVSAAIAKYPDIDRDWIIKETIRTNGNFSPLQLAEGRFEADEVVTNKAVADFLDKHPELAEVYKTKYSSTDGQTTPAKEKPKAIPNLSNTASKPAAPSLEPKDGESNSAFLSRLWDSMGG